MKRNDYPYPDDDIMVIPRGGNPGAGPGASAALFVAEPDIAAVNATARPERLLRNDGTHRDADDQKRLSSPIPSSRATICASAPAPRSITLRSFLSAQAIRANNSMDDIDYCSSNNSTVCAVQSISVPVLFAAMGAHYFIRDNERHFDMAKSKDKDFIVIEGAVHGFTPCTACEKTPGQYSNSVKNLFDYAANWINARY